MVNGDMQNGDEVEEIGENELTTKPRGKTRTTQLKSVDNLNPNVPEFIPPASVNGKMKTVVKGSACGDEIGDAADVNACTNGVDSKLHINEKEADAKNCDNTGK